MNSDATTPANPTTDDSGPIPADQSTPGGAVYQHDDPAYRVFVDSLNHLDPDEIATVLDAYNFSEQAHQGQTRLSGEPYLSHPLAVASILAEMGFDEPTISAGLLHDTVEDTKATIEELDDNFGEEVADIVDGVTKISQITFENKEEAQAENIRKMILAMSHDMRVLMVKLADRLPWAKIEKEYNKRLRNSHCGAGNKPARMVVGALIVKHVENLSDVKTIQAIQENPYMQYLLGLSKFTEKPVFVPELFVLIRKRLDRTSSTC